MKHNELKIIKTLTKKYKVNLSSNFVLRKKFFFRKFKKIK